jgi:hypothetical protein
MMMQIAKAKQGVMIDRQNIAIQTLVWWSFF